METDRKRICDQKYALIIREVRFKAGKRVTLAIDRRTKRDFAFFVKKVVDEECPNVDTIRLIVDNLSAHSKSSFYETFGRKEAERILSNIEFHYTPKHASWLNVAEIEINTMDAESTGRRIRDMGLLAQQVTAWTRRRNQQKKKIDWRFTGQDADKKLSKYYI